ncbi:uncharacterized protein LOC129745895 [Uranotaenia lowii]|uniref:uncharacterized protein LOC129745895 n=1 Tax=Uranotaenia lowii TaxID=190385 RepID=UPI00247AF60D|nr:uncharacterized protein LOC129745895 [Uranotaenia lowii]XP_055595243.1 uncharacterized protein LOC129745895 [Uranotaenia lowii]
MDLTSLPVEILEEIFSKLNHRSLLEASLVCHYWKLVVEPLIARRSCLNINLKMLDHLEVLKDSIRKYQSVLIVNGQNDYWDKIREILNLLYHRIKPRYLRIRGVLSDQLYRFYSDYGAWFDELESINVGMDDRFTSYSSETEDENFHLFLPKLKTLTWYECLYGTLHTGEKSVTVEAPNLEVVDIDDSLDPAAVLKIPYCKKLKRIGCLFYTKMFRNTFIDDEFAHLQHLTVSCAYTNDDLSFLERMDNLRTLELTCSQSGLRVIERLKSLNHLRALQISIHDQSLERVSLNLTRLCSLATKIERIEFINFEIRTFGTVIAEQLCSLKFKEVKIIEQDFTLFAPKLKVLSIPLSILATTHIVNNERLSEFYLDLESTYLDTAFQNYLSPFLQQHATVAALILRNPCRNDQNISQFKVRCEIPRAIERLELRKVALDLDFFRYISHWYSLKHLSLDRVTIDCGRNAEQVVDLPCVTSINVYSGTLVGIEREHFPLRIGCPESGVLFERHGDYFHTMDSEYALAGDGYD